MRGGKYLAEERGAFDAEATPPPAVTAEAAATPARAKLYEAAASHDGQPSMEWLRFFMRTWNAEIG